jgi:hypothetical protein
MRRAVVFLAILLPACAGSPDPGGDVVGTWHRDGRTLTFSADGHATDERADGQRWSGTYTTGEGQLTLITGDDALEQRTAYLADDQHLLLDLATPDDDGADPVATWTSTSMSGTSQLSTTLILRADHTAHLEQIGVTDRDAYDGTWDEHDGDITVTSGSAVVHFALYQGYVGTLFDR